MVCLANQTLDVVCLAICYYCVKFSVCPSHCTLIFVFLAICSLKYKVLTFRAQDVAADSLSKFYYPPVAAVSLSYPKEAIRPECLIDGELKGFGQLHPRSQGVETLGICSHSTIYQ